MSGDVTPEMVDFLKMHVLRFYKLKDQGADLEKGYRVLRALLDETGMSDLYKTILSDHVEAGVLKDRFDESIRTVELMFLPFAAELSEAPCAAVRRAVTGLIDRSRLWGFKGAYFDHPLALSREPKAILAATNELRVIAAVESLGLPRDLRNKVISTSSNALLLTLNTPLHILLKARPERGTEIVDVIKREREIDGNRIAEILDAECVSMASGIL